MAEPYTWLTLAVLTVGLSSGGWALKRAALKANRTDWGKPWMNLLDGINRLFCLRYHRLNSSHLHLPDQGPVILVANHVSGLDPMLLIASARRPLRFLIAREQYERFGLQWLFRAVGCIPVDREGRPERAMRMAARALEQGEVVALFPHGAIHLDSDPPRRLKAGAVRLAAIANCPITPARITGIRGEGKVIPAVFMRARAHVEGYPPLSVGDREPKAVLDEIAAIIEGRGGNLAE